MQTLLGNLRSSCEKKIGVNKTVLVTSGWRENVLDYYITKTKTKNSNNKKTSNPKLLAGILKQFNHFLLEQILGMAK